MVSPLIRYLARLEAKLLIGNIVFVIRGGPNSALPRLDIDELFLYSTEATAVCLYDNRGMLRWVKSNDLLVSWDEI